MKNRPFRERMGFALEGIRAGWAREASFRAQTALASCALLALLVLRPAPIWWGLVAVTCALVLAISIAAVVVGAAMVMATAPRFLAEIGW